MTLRVLERSVYRGPHRYGGVPMIRIMLDIGDFADRPTNDLPGFVDALLERLPGLARHHCSKGRSGGFLERLHDGTLIGHVVEHVALELQAAAGSESSRGKTRAVKSRPGVYNVLYAYREERVGLAAGRAALELVASVGGAMIGEVEGLGLLWPEPVSELDELVRKSSLGPTTAGIADEALRRGIPVQRMDDRSLVRFGWGSRQRTIRASITDATAHLAVELAADKQRTRAALAAAGVPVPRGIEVVSADDALAAADGLGGSVVIKPTRGNHGRGVTVGAVGEDEVRVAFETAKAATRDESVVVEEFLEGRDYRVLVVDGAVVAVAERRRPTVLGDGIHTVDELVGMVNDDPRRGDGHARALTRVAPDEALIARESLTLESVPEAGRAIVLRDTANLSTGGEAIDRTDELHPENRSIAERAAHAIGLDIVGLDVISPDLSRPLRQTGGGVIEANAAPGFRMHTHPSHGTPRQPASAVVDLLFPKGSRARIPITSVTGTNGKSTTVRMIAHILGQDGRTVGMTNTSGVYIGADRIQKVDASGPRSARAVLSNRSVDVAVLETARGGILREGLAYDRADVGVVLNVTPDHLGLKGVETLRELAVVKGVVARRVRRRGVTVLNYDDPLTRRMSDIAGGRVAWFTMGALDEILQRHIGQGGIVAAVDGTTLVVHRDGERMPIVEITEIPVALGGAARFNVANALAAAAAAIGQAVPIELIASGLRTFVGGYTQNPGRLNFTTAPGFTTIVDYAHNPAALRALGELVAGLRADHERVIGVISTPGDRRDVDIHELGTLSAAIFDDVIFRELPDGRGRPTGGVINLLSDAAREAGMATERIQRVYDEQDAATTALRMAGPSDLVVITVSDVDAIWNLVQTFSASLPVEPAGVQ